MVVRIVKTCGFPASIRLAISRVLSCVPVGRKSTDASFSFAVGCAESDDVRAIELWPERLAAASLRSRFRRAIPSVMVLVIVVPAGLSKAPPRLSAVFLSTGGPYESTERHIYIPSG